VASKIELTCRCYSCLRRIKSCRRALTRTTAATVVNSLDYCNGFLAGCTKQTLDKLQRVLNCSARVICGGYSRQHVTPLLRDHLHWLRARERISFKLCILVCKAIHGLSPCYLNDRCTPVSTVPYLSAVRSAAHGDLVVARTRLQLGNRAFCVAGPVAWNIRSAPTLSTFKVMLKTHLFSRSYFSDCFPEYEQRTLCGALVVTLAMLLRFVNCRFLLLLLLNTYVARQL